MPVNGFIPQATPLTEEIRLEIFGSRDLTDFWVDLSSDGDSVYSRETLFASVILGNVFNMHGDSRENLLKILAVTVVII